MPAGTRTRFGALAVPLETPRRVDVWHVTQSVLKKWCVAGFSRSNTSVAFGALAAAAFGSATPAATAIGPVGPWMSGAVLGPVGTGETFGDENGWNTSLTVPAGRFGDPLSGVSASETKSPPLFGTSVIEPAKKIHGSAVPRRPMNASAMVCA